MNDFDYFTEMFEMTEGTGASKKILTNIVQEIEGLRNLWEHIQKMEDTFDRFLKMDWKDLKCSDMEDEAKAL